MEEYRDAVMRISAESYPIPPNIMGLYEAYNNIPPLRRHRILSHELYSEICFFLEETKGHTLEDLQIFIDQFF